LRSWQGLEGLGISQYVLDSSSLSSFCPYEFTVVAGTIAIIDMNNGIAFSIIEVQ
jgi:hypothetical protein